MAQWYTDSQYFIAIHLPWIFPFLQHFIPFFNPKLYFYGVKIKFWLKHVIFVCQQSIIPSLVPGARLEPASPRGRGFKFWLTHEILIGYIMLCHPRLVIRQNYAPPTPRYRRGFLRLTGSRGNVSEFGGVWTKLALVVAIVSFLKQKTAS